MTKLQFPSLTKGQQLAEIYEALGGTMNKRSFETLSEDQQFAEIWEEIGAPAAGGGLPDQTGNGGKVLRTNGTDATWSFDGSTLTELDAAELIGVVPDGSFPATLPAASGVNLTALNATNLGSGTLPDARFPETLPLASGENLIALNGSFIASGNIAAARITTALTTAQPVAATTLSATGQVTIGTDWLVSRSAAATGQFGGLHATTPTNQILRAHDVTTGTGAALTLKGGTGTSAVGSAIVLNGGISTTTGGSIVLQTAAAGTLTDRMTIASTGAATFPAGVASTSTTTGTLVVTGGVGISGSLYLGGTLLSTSSIVAGAAANFGFNASTFWAAPSNGVLLLYNYAGTDFNRIQYGGVTSSFPCHKRRGATLEARLADDSAITTFVGAMVLVAGAVTDGAFTNPVDGCHGYDTTNFKHYIRSGGAWKSSAAYT